MNGLSLQCMTGDLVGVNINSAIGDGAYKCEWVEIETVWAHLDDISGDRLLGYCSHRTLLWIPAGMSNHSFLVLDVRNRLDA